MAKKAHPSISEIFGEPDLDKPSAPLRKRFDELLESTDSARASGTLPQKTIKVLDSVAWQVAYASREIADESTTPEERIEAAERLLIAATLTAQYAPLPPATLARYEKQITKTLAKLGGKQSGAVRSKQAAENWQDYALRLAQAFREKDEGGGYKNMMKYIEDNWPGKVLPVSPEHMTRLFTRWVKLGKLKKKISA
jgi:hypothetical protein